MSLFTKVIRKATRSSDAAFAQSPLGHKVFFVSGHPRSGTNWVSALLNLHPAISCDGEFHFQILRQAFQGFTSLPWYLASREPVRSAAEESFANLIRRCLQAQADTPSAPNRDTATIFGDHTPRMVMPLIEPPEGGYINIIRDGRDVLVSWTFHLLSTGKPEIVLAPVRPLLARELERLPRPKTDGVHQGASPASIIPRNQGLVAAARALLEEPAWVHHYAAGWAMHVQHDMRTLKQIQGETSDAPASTAGSADHADPACEHSAAQRGVLHLRYERLHAETDAQRTRMYRFLGVDPAEALPLSAHSRTTPGFGGHEAPGAFYRKGQVGDWRNYFSSATTACFKEAAGETLIKLGYERGPDW